MIRITPPERLPQWRAVIALPNLLTYARIPLAALIWLAPTHLVFFFTLIALATLTDTLDGSFARRARARRLERGDDPEDVAEIARAGAWLDPFCDKVFLLSALVAVFFQSDMALWHALLIATREVLYAPLFLLWRITPRLRAMRACFDFTANQSGRTATICQFFALGAVVVGIWAVPLAIVAGVAGLNATVFYAMRAWRLYYETSER